MFNQPPAMPPISPAPTIAPSGASKLEPKAPGNSGLLKTVIIIFLVLFLIGALFLAYYFYNEYKLASSDVDGQVAAAVLDREKEITDKLEAEFAAREKTPYKTLTGPSDYGSVSFKFPKTWSVYVARDASNGGNYEAYLHPSEVPEVATGTIFALRLTITSDTFESVNSRYAYEVGKTVSSSAITVGSVNATRYDGKLPNSAQGSAVLFKVRDKTIVLQTDAEIYRDDFNQILETVTYNL
ncbi:hypothetical protein IKE71_02365 [Candidatus Saccharibacteria bacterium]|nr:hypothetical protein [Candidatus Saccharibacteria bacterium]